MAEAAFAKSFLSTFDGRKRKILPDHVEDAKNFPARPPYILPRMPKPMSKPVKLAPGQERSITVVLRSLRNPLLDIKLTSQPLHTSLLDLKSKVSEQTQLPINKIKILYKKRPMADSKVIKELLSENDTTLELSVMLMGGSSTGTGLTAVTSGSEGSTFTSGFEPTGAAVVETEAFWTDLGGYLMQRLRDQGSAEELARLFRSAWETNRSGP